MSEQTYIFVNVSQNVYWVKLASYPLMSDSQQDNKRYLTVIITAIMHAHKLEAPNVNIA